MEKNTSWLKNQLDRKEEEIFHLHQKLAKSFSEEGLHDNGSLENSWFSQQSEKLSERFRYEKYSMSVDWKLKMNLQEVCPLEYYYDKLLFCAKREVFNLLDINHGCKEDMEKVKICSTKRDRFMQEFRKRNRLQQEETQSNTFFPASGITERQYKTHQAKSNHEFDKMMQNFKKE